MKKKCIVMIIVMSLIATAAFAETIYTLRPDYLASGNLSDLHEGLRYQVNGKIKALHQMIDNHKLIVTREGVKVYLVSRQTEYGLVNVRTIHGPETIWVAEGAIGL